MTERGESRTLWLLRHAKARSDPPPGGTDHDRALAPKGLRDADALGHKLATFGLPVPTVALTSTARRTIETATAATAGLGIVLDRRRSLYYGAPEDVLAEVRTLADEVRSAMVVGHNPTTHALALELLAEDADGAGALTSFPTCGLAVLEVPADTWRDLAPGTARLAGFFRPPF